LQPTPCPRSVDTRRRLQKQRTKRRKRKKKMAKVQVQSGQFKMAKLPSGKKRRKTKMEKVQVSFPYNAATPWPDRLCVFLALAAWEWQWQGDFVGRVLALAFGTTLQPSVSCWLQRRHLAIASVHLQQLVGMQRALASCSCKSIMDGVNEQRIHITRPHTSTRFNELYALGTVCAYIQAHTHTKTHTPWVYVLLPSGQVHSGNLNENVVFGSLDGDFEAADAFLHPPVLALQNQAHFIGMSFPPSFMRTLRLKRQLAWTCNT
jgi:hypothetical protein